MRTQQKLEKLVSNQTDSSVSVDEKVEAAGRGPFLFPTYLGRSKGLCSQGRLRMLPNKTGHAGYIDTAASYDAYLST